MDTELLTRESSTPSSDAFPALPRAGCWENSTCLPVPALPSHPLLRGDRAYLRALRAAEMKAWQASGGDVFHPNPRRELS